MSGVIGRSGRRARNTQKLAITFDEVADITFQQAGMLLRDESVSLLDRVRVCMPLALKRIPDKQEVKAININIDDSTAQRMLERAERNLLIYKKIQQAEAETQATIDTTSDVGATPPPVTVTTPLSRGDKI